MEAARGARDHGLAYYNAQIWASARLNQVTIVFSEDFSDGQVLEGVASSILSHTVSGWKIGDDHLLPPARLPYFAKSGDLHAQIVPLNIGKSVEESFQNYLDYGVLDTAMVETAVYVLEKE